MRVKRKKCKYSVYHLIVRGNNRQPIFLDNSDKMAYLDRLKRYALRYNFHIYAYCLMTNHIHLLAYDNGRDVSKFMQGLNLSYTIYFNKKYDNCGHLFQDRFKSIMIQSDAQFLQVAKYIHLNPVKANIVTSPQQYPWSSYKFYLGNSDPLHLVNTSTLLQYFSSSKRLQRQHFLDYMNIPLEEDSDFILKLADTISYMNTDFRPKHPTLNIQSLLISFCKHFNVSTLELCSRYRHHMKSLKALAIYTLAYGVEAEYIELSRLFHLCPSSIGRYITHAINLFTQQPDLLKEIELIFN